MKKARSRSAKSHARTNRPIFSQSTQAAHRRGQQVAAVCYRWRGEAVEFLLVQSRGGRWIFPKGSIESGLTSAQSAALEAFEEAGVHGRIEEISFARYIRRESGGRQARAKSANSGITVHAFLCEVCKLDCPQESNRNRTWFTAPKAKRRLQQDRTQDFGADLARVIDRALSRIQRLHSPTNNSPERMHGDTLHKVHLDAFEDARPRSEVWEAALARFFLGQRRAARSAAIEGEIRRPVLRLGSGTDSSGQTTQNVTGIDNGRKPA